MSYYKSLTNPNYLNNKININDALPVMKTNAERIGQLLLKMNEYEKQYYMYFLDGDNWKERETWKCNSAVWRFDFQCSYDMFCAVKYKDCIVQLADEIIIISPYDISKKIDAILKSKNFTMTKLVYQSASMNYRTVAVLSHMVREKKNIQKGTWYYISELEMEGYELGNK